MTDLTASAGRGRLAEVLATRGGRAEPEAPFVIEHREALIYMLCQAAELEHGLMCQYLFAAFSLKQRADEGLTPEELDAVTRWRRMIAHVATQEMLHLALVQNVLSAIGAGPHLTRPNLPAPARHYPAGVNLTLVPFGEPALQHFIFLERPEGMALEGAKGIDAPMHEALPLMAEGEIVPQLQDFATVGHLYRSIEQGLEHLAEKFGERHLFVGPPRAQATTTDFPWPELVAVTDLASARRAFDTILEQGEGCRGHWETAHFGQFVQILEEYRRMLSANAAFDPVRPVMFATVRRGEHDDSIPLIGDRATSLCTDLFNVSYEILLLTLERYFAHTEETDAQLGTLANAAVTLMRAVLRPFGDLITTLPVGPEHPGRTAGPSFELFYEDIDLLPHRNSAWALLEERVRDASTFCDAVIKNSPEQVATALRPAQGALTAVADSLAAHFGDWGAASRFTTRHEVPSMPGPDEPIGFEQHIKPLFRERDRDSMRFRFDLWSLEDVSTHANAILHRLEAGTMPCDGAWPAERVAVFRCWIDVGKPASVVAGVARHITGGAERHPAESRSHARPRSTPRARTSFFRSPCCSACVSRSATLT